MSNATTVQPQRVGQHRSRRKQAGKTGGEHTSFINEPHARITATDSSLYVTHAVQMQLARDGVLVQVGWCQAAVNKTQGHKAQRSQGMKQREGRNRSMGCAQGTHHNHSFAPLATVRGDISSGSVPATAKSANKPRCRTAPVRWPAEMVSATKAVCSPTDEALRGALRAGSARAPRKPARQLRGTQETTPDEQTAKHKLNRKKREK